MKGNRVIHTTRGGVYQGNVGEPPRGLTAEQAREQRSGTKIDERQSREAAERVVEAKPRRTRKSSSDELTAAPYGKKPVVKKK